MTVGQKKSFSGQISLELTILIRFGHLKINSKLIKFQRELGADLRIFYLFFRMSLHTPEKSGYLHRNSDANGTRIHGLFFI